MKILRCPLNGPRNISEFVWGGEMKPMPNPATATDAEWTEYLFLEDNIAGEITEWWLHAPTNYWFVARRNTITDEIIETMTYDQFLARRKEAAALSASHSDAAAKPDTAGPQTGASGA
ncbi:MAG: sarcosine oxidase subunit delta [Deltaproteobacteria bacterium]